MKYNSKLSCKSTSLSIKYMLMSKKVDWKTLLLLKMRQLFTSNGEKQIKSNLYTKRDRKFYTLLKNYFFLASAVFLN
jgi:hypothetical protein